MKYHLIASYTVFAVSFVFPETFSTTAAYGAACAITLIAITKPWKGDAS